jgi:uroporphyrinogen-III synthase
MSESAQISAAGPLTRIVLTRSAEDCESWAASLRERGIASVQLPCIETQCEDSPTLQTALVAALAEADWLVFTSERGVTALRRQLSQALPEHIRIAVVGPATARRALAELGRADFLAQRSTAASLASELVDHLESSRAQIVLALAENAGDVLEKTLSNAGHSCRRFNVYRTIPAAAPEQRRTLKEIGGQTIFLASPSAVLGLVNQVEIDDSARLISIGPSTTAAIERAGLQVYAQAATPSLTGMLEAIKD